MDRLERAHGDRQLVTEADDGLSLTYAQAAKRVAPLGRRHRRQGLPGRSSWSSPRPTGTSSSSCASPRRAPGPSPHRSTTRCAARRSTTSCATRAPALVLRSAVAGRTTAQPMAEAHPADPGDVAALFYTSGTTGTPKGAALTHRALVGPGGQRRAVAHPPAPRRGRRSRCPSPTSWASPCSSGWPSPGIPTYLLPKFNPVEGARRHRAAAGHDVRRCARHVPDAATRPAPPSTTSTSVRVWASGADAMPPELAERFKKMGATRHHARARARSARPPSPRATAWSRSGEAWPPRCRRPTSAPPRAPGRGARVRRCRATEMRVVDDDGAEVRQRRRSASCR